jgi:hypothetical protein
MANEVQGCGDYAVATLHTNAKAENPIGLEGYWTMSCRDVNGNLKWEEGFENQVVQVGKILMMNNTLYSQTAIVGPFLGLIATATTYSPTDTFASHAGWTEFTNYTVGGSAVRGTATFSTATGNNVTTSGSNIVTSSAPAITYAITGAGGTITGCFLLTGTGATNAFSNTTVGTLWSAGGFSVAKTTTVGDTVAVTYSTTATS